MRQDNATGPIGATNRGASAIEYGLIAGSIAVAIAGSIWVLGVNVGGIFSGASKSIQSASERSTSIRPVSLTNGGLESNVPAGRWAIGKVEGWTNSGSNGGIEQWGQGFSGVTASEGNSFIELDADSAGIDHIQTSVDLVVGKSYTLLFDCAARPGPGVKDDVEITHNGNVIAVVSPRSTDQFETVRVPLTGMEGPDVIGFREFSGQNNSYGVLLDNVRIE